MARFTKPFLNPQQQAQLLMSRGMVINDVQKAEECLARIGYYRLSAYWYPFRESFEASDLDRNRIIVLGDNFRPNTDFSTVHGFYVFDKRLRLVILDALERVEVAVRTKIALLLGSRDPWAHRQARFLHGNFSKRPKHPGALVTKHQEWLDRIDDQFRRSREDFARHFQTTYPCDLPPIWVAVELWDFGTLSHLYSGMTKADKESLAAAYGIEDGALFGTWLRCLNDVRNLCAHHSRLWNRPLVNPPRLPAVGTLPTFDHMIGQVRQETRLYAVAMILRHLLLVINPATDWGTRLRECVSTLPTTPHVTLDSAGFPTAWEALPAWT